MFFGYVDESERDGTHYFLGAAMCTEEQSRYIEIGFAAILAKYGASFPGLEPTTEFHGSAMMRAEESPWRRIPLRARFAIYGDALEVISASDCRIYIEGIDTVAHAARGYANPTPARELAFSHLFERMNSCAREAETTVQVVADEHHTSEISRSNFNRYKLWGTYGYRSSKLANVLPEIQFVKSQTSPSLQAIDLVTYLFNRRVTIKESDRRAEEQKLVLWQKIAAATTWPRGRTRIWP